MRDSEAILTAGRAVMAEARLQALEARSERDGKAILCLDSRWFHDRAEVCSVRVDHYHGTYSYGEEEWDGGYVSISRDDAFKLVLEVTR